jgi:predicted peroxiredoxin
MKSQNLLRLVCAVFVMAILANAVGAGSAEAKDGVFIHVTHGQDDPHRVLMALSMAGIMAEDRDVLVYFDIRGVEVVLQDAEDLTYKHFPSARKQLSDLPKQGVILMACPGCLKAAGKTPKDLAPGVQVADKDRFFNFTEGRILTLDY